MWRWPEISHRNPPLLRTHLYFLPPATKILKAFPKLIPPKLSQTSTRQPNFGEKTKSKPEILLSDVRTSEGDILRLEQDYEVLDL